MMSGIEREAVAWQYYICLMSMAWPRREPTWARTREDPVFTGILYRREPLLNSSESRRSKSRNLWKNGILQSIGNAPMEHSYPTLECKGHL